jgi:hypothetical protein
VAQLSRQAVRRLVHDALVARVGLLLGQHSFDHLLAEQGRVSLALARGAHRLHASGAHGPAAMAQSVLTAFELEPGFYAGSELDYIVSEGLTSVGLALGECVRGHENDDRSGWQAQVVPLLDRIAEFAVSVLDGSWARSGMGLTLSQWMAPGRGQS